MKLSRALSDLVKYTKSVGIHDVESERRWKQWALYTQEKKQKRSALNLFLIERLTSLCHVPFPMEDSFVVLTLKERETGTVKILC